MADEISRRTLIATTAFVPLAALTGSAQQAAPAAPVSFTSAQMKTLEALIDRLIPRDELGPGAVDAGAQIYIDRLFASTFANDKSTFIAGLEAVDAYAKRVHGSA